jgi:hypothetical protein
MRENLRDGRGNTDETKQSAAESQQPNSSPTPISRPPQHPSRPALSPLLLCLPACLPACQPASLLAAPLALRLQSWPAKFALPCSLHGTIRFRPKLHRSRPLLPPTQSLTIHSLLSRALITLPNATRAYLSLLPPSLFIPPSPSSNLLNSFSRSVCVNCFLSISRSLVSFRIAGVFDFTCFPIRIEVFLAVINLVNS